jgi:hypothetical protein
MLSEAKHLGGGKTHSLSDPQGNVWSPSERSKDRRGGSRLGDASRPIARSTRETYSLLVT